MCVYVCVLVCGISKSKKWQRAKDILVVQKKNMLYDCRKLFTHAMKIIRVAFLPKKKDSNKYNKFLLQECSN